MKLVSLTKWLHIIIPALILCLAFLFGGSDHDFRKRIQYITFDAYNRILPRTAPEKKPSVIVDIDEKSLKKFGQWPWPRSTMAALVTSLDNLGAKVIAFDMVFAEPDRTSPARIAQTLPLNETYASARNSLSGLPDNDAVFAQSISVAGNVVTGFTRARPDETLRLPYKVAEPMFFQGDKKPYLTNVFSADGIVENLPQLAQSAAGNGSFMATPDIDGIIRDVPLFIEFTPRVGAAPQPDLYPLLSIEALRVSESTKARLQTRPVKDQTFFGSGYSTRIGDPVNPADSIVIPVENDLKIKVYYRDIKDDEYISVQQIFDPAQVQTMREKIAGKIVFVGTSAEGLRDIRSTPLDVFVPGVEVHVNIIEQILQGKFLSRPLILIDMEGYSILIAGLLVITLARYLPIAILSCLTAGLMASMFVISWLGYKYYGLLIDPFYPAMSLLFIFLSSTILNYIRSESERRQVRQAFGFYISPAFMDELTKNPEKLKLGGEVRDLTVMFTDIRSFTTISENLTPEELIQLMNDFLTPMSDLVMNNRGTIDKYMGDAMMAFWNAPLDDRDHELHACLTALKMNEALIPVNESVQARAIQEGRVPVLLNAGIGINTGPCSVGNMGSRQRFAYSALGDAVNLASRLESQTKTYGVNILVGEDTRRKVPELAMLELDIVRVKGKDKPVRIYNLLGDEAMALDPDFVAWEETHLSMLASYRAAEWDDAFQKVALSRKAAKGKLKIYYDLYAERIVELMKNPPRGDWGGIYTAKDK